MPDTAIKNKLIRLVQVQKIDAEIYALKKTLKEKPMLIQELSDNFELSKSRLKALEENLQAVLLARKDKELELKTKEEEIVKANAQLSQIKTNKEYTAKISEIESIKADKSIFEENILSSFDESDTIKQDIDKEKDVVAEREKEFLEKKKEIDQEVRDIEAKIKNLDGERQKITPEIDRELLARYERILVHKEGLAIVPVHGNACGGCFMNVTSQKVNALRMLDEIVECEICSRILYLEDCLE